jgi:hypothetical protein
MIYSVSKLGGWEKPPARVQRCFLQLVNADLAAPPDAPASVQDLLGSIKVKSKAEILESLERGDPVAILVPTFTDQSDVVGKFPAAPLFMDKPPVVYAVNPATTAGVLRLEYQGPLSGGKVPKAFNPTKEGCAYVMLEWPDDIQVVTPRPNSVIAAEVAQLMAAVAEEGEAPGGDDHDEKEGAADPATQPPPAAPRVTPGTSRASPPPTLGSDFWSLDGKPVIARVGDPKAMAAAGVFILRGADKVRGHVIAIRPDMGTRVEAI